MARFVFSKSYSETMERIENHVFETTESVEQVNAFLDEHDRVLKFIEQNPKTSKTHPITGDQSWVFGSGRYRLFFNAIEANNELIIYLTHLIDNREINIDIYPSNTFPTYDEE